VEYEIDLAVSGLSEDMPLPLPPEVLAMLEGRSSFVLVSDGAVDVVIGEDGEPQTIGAVLNAAWGEIDDDIVTIPFEIRLVDDYLYVRNGDNDTTWQGANLADAANDEELTEEPETTPIIPMTGEMLDLSGLENIDVDALANLPGLATQVRDGDSFTMAIELNALSALLQDEYADLYEGIATELSAIDQNLAFLFVMLPSIPFEEGTLTLTQHVNTETNVVDGIDVSVALNVNLAQFMGQPDGEPIIIHLDASADFVNVGSAPAAVAPAEFEEVPLSELLGGM
jgi:hypothetical protein